MDTIERFDPIGSQMVPSATGQWVKWSHAADINAAAWKSAGDIQRRKQIAEDNPPEVGGLFYGNAYFHWSWKGVGFGQLSFSYNKETQKISCMNEGMSRESVRKLLHALADHIADNVSLDEDE